MSADSKRLNWSLEAFLDCYNSIKLQGAVPDVQIEALLNDLRNILLVPTRNEKSRSALAAGEKGEPVTFHSGQEFTLNQAFVASASSLASELNLDEISAAELLHEASSTNFAQGSSAFDAGILSFYQRWNYILNIVGFYISEKQLHVIYTGKVADVLPQMLKSFKQIYSLVSLQNDLIDKETATGDVNDLRFVNKVTYAREQLFDLHELLARALYSLIDNYIQEFGSYDTYSLILTHINENVKENADILILHFLPALMRIVTCLEELKEENVYKFHLSLVSTLVSDYSKVNLNDEIDTTKSSLRPHELLLQLIFFISFVPWCKQSVLRTQKFDFENDILKYAEWLINYGTMEQLLSYCAETANHATETTFDRSKLFDFRPLLQRTTPRLRPALFVYSRNEELLQVARTKPEYTNLYTLCDYLSLTISADMREELLAPFFHSFFYDFVNHSAIILTSLRDSEEDFLLSSVNKKQLESNYTPRGGARFKEDREFASANLDVTSSLNTSDYGIDLDELATRAELERFYLAFAYTYSNRPEVCQAFWAHDSGNIMGFVSWGLANNTSPLITATFCLLLGSLTYGGNASSDKVWEILLNSGLSKKNDYSQISIDSIVGSLSYYIEALEENIAEDYREQRNRSREMKDLFVPKENSALEASPDPIQLSEDSIVFIAGFMVLILMVIENLTSATLKRTAFLQFYPVIASFLKLDNLITSSRISPSQNDVITVLFDEENRTAIVNLVLNLLTKFADNASLELKCKIWSIVDKWVSHSIADEEDWGSLTSESGRPSSLTIPSTGPTKSESSMQKMSNRKVSMKKGFEINLVRMSQVLNFVKLMEHLLAKNESAEEYSTFGISFPADLGHATRQKKLIGIWPYMEYLLTEVLAKSLDLEFKDIKHDLQKLILSIIVSSLREVRWDIIDNTAEAILPDFTKFKDSFASALLCSGNPATLSLQNFARLHQSMAILNYMFDHNTSKTLFDIIDRGSKDSKGAKNDNVLVLLALDSLTLIFKLQESFILRLPVLKNFDGNRLKVGTTAGYGTSMSLVLSSPQLEFNNIYFPDNVGTKGVRDYYELLLFHISSVAHISLYVGSSNIQLAQSSLEILQRVSKSLAFAPTANNHLLQHNRLLSIFQGIDESETIKFGFVQQMEAFTPCLKPKYSILRFLWENLPLTNEITIAHFLLGFRIKATTLQIEDSEESCSLLRVLLNMLLDTIPLMAEVKFGEGYHTSVELGPATLSSLIMNIFVRLCRNRNSSKVTMHFLRQLDLFIKVLNAQPRLDELTLWQKQRFNGEFQGQPESTLITDKDSRDAYYEFANYRKAVLQYLSLELHSLLSRSSKEHNMSLLLDGSAFLDGTAKILNLLDVLNYQFSDPGQCDLSEFEKHFEVTPLARELERWIRSHDDFDLVSELTKLKRRVANNALHDEEAKKTFGSNAEFEGIKVRRLLEQIIYIRQARSVQLETLRAWAQIVKALASDELTKKTNLIPQVFLAILPRINNEYFERNIPFAEELISLCLFLFEILEQEYHHNSDQIEGGSLQGLIALFETCANGLLHSNSTPVLRADLYFLINKLLLMSLNNGSFLNNLTSVLQLIDSRFIGVVCNDSINSEGVSRIASLLLLESLVRMSNLRNSGLIIQILANNNFLSLLVRSLKRADGILSTCEKAGDGDTGPIVTLETLFYELTALKSTLYVLVRLGQTRSGASQLVHDDIFATLRGLKFLAMDAEVGMSYLIELNDDKSGTKATLKLALDVPLTLNEKTEQGRESSKTLTLYEILTPIFQLIATLLLSLGPSYKPGITEVEGLLKYSHSIVLGVIKRDSLLDTRQITCKSNRLTADVQEDMKLLVDLIILISTMLSNTKSGDV